MSNRMNTVPVLPAKLFELTIVEPPEERTFQVLNVPRGIVLSDPDQVGPDFQTREEAEAYVRHLNKFKEVTGE